LCVFLKDQHGYHGTIRFHAKDILKNGINLERGFPKSDFGPGFYVGNDYEFCKEKALQVQKNAELKYEKDVKELKRLSKQPSTPKEEIQKVKARVDESKMILDDSEPVVLVYEVNMEDFPCIDLTLQKSLKPFYDVVGYYR
jgi:hypothetical protein